MARFNEHIASLHPKVQPLARLFLQEAYEAGLDPRVMETQRSRERQEQLYAQGRTAPGAVVTKARGGQSNHNYGVAFDVVPGALLAQKNWAPEDARWAQLGSLAAKHGLEWGGNWKFVDRPHFQLAGANWRALQNDPEFAQFSGGAPGPRREVPTQTPTNTPGAPGGLADLMVASVAGAPSASGVGTVPPAPSPEPAGMMLGNIASLYLQGHQRRAQERQEMEAAEAARRQALFGGLGGLYG